MDSTLYNPKNQGIQIQLRYYRDSLAISGSMVIVMSIWDIIKLFIGFFLGEDTIKELVEATIYENGISAIGTKYESTMRALTWVSILLILSIFVAIIFLYHLYIGLNAYRVGRQTTQKSNRFYLVLTILSTIFAGMLILSNVLVLFNSTDERGIPDFDMDKYISQYVHSQDKSDTYLGRFFNGALSQKKMVAEKIKESGNKLAGM